MSTRAWRPCSLCWAVLHQAVYPNGLKVYCEQISHHPPISSWEVYEPSGKVRHGRQAVWTDAILTDAVQTGLTGGFCGLVRTLSARTRR
jgi:hypothetical protein